MKQTDQPTEAFPHKAGWAHTTALVNSLDGLVLHSTSSGHRGDDLGNVAADFHLTGRLSEGGQQVSIISSNARKQSGLSAPVHRNIGSRQTMAHAREPCRSSKAPPT
ncbi:uncharacterized protein AKAW2_70805S [Aspergillus luchuensis]|uniref:Uncharacterized protein n=1 Tax=Aspergillus kawachii TaxID=1069201 RepID=A0A7R8A3R4_ASPKA|nr:uncharacterized protein AKAW2_70805S [Aspergillus luchuensis]BCS03927.1 hypothetical protein AKAW2_70805S [Aspergillus luchuensis]